MPNSAGQLYNLKDDPYEQKDLFEKLPDVVSKLSAELQKIKGGNYR